MNKYSLTSTVFAGQVIMGYILGQLHYFDSTGASLDDKQYFYLIDNMPIKEEDIHALVKKSKTVSIKLLPTDLSFDRFWAEYNYKIGNKKRAKKLWSDLKESDKIKAFEAMPKYKQFLMLKNGIEKLYPETFLFQRRFENQY